MKVKKANYGNYSSNNYGANSIRLDVGSLSLWFSYDTVVAFQEDGNSCQVSENCWGPTTGKHLNWIESDKKARLSRDVFEHNLERVLATHNLIV